MPLTDLLRRVPPAGGLARRLPASPSDLRGPERGVVGAEVGDPVPAAHAEPAQAVRQPGDPVMQLGVGQPVITMEDRDPVRGAARAPRDPRADTVVAHPGSLQLAAPARRGPRYA